MPKDLFSDNADKYALYRPTYPAALFSYILYFVSQKKLAWDCASGNGQAALPLSDDFEKVIASDISEKQLKAAPTKSNIDYVVCPAEETPFPDDQFDLITIAQAYHWLNWERFHKEATRVGKNGCVVAIWMYDLLRCEDEKVNGLIDYFYKEITGPYWDAERRHVDDHYAAVQFDFSPLPSLEFASEVVYTKEDLLGYFSTWSALKNYFKTHGSSPIDLIVDKLNSIWEDGAERKFRFPIYLKIGKIIK